MALNNLDANNALSKAMAEKNAQAQAQTNVAPQSAPQQAQSEQVYVQPNTAGDVNDRFFGLGTMDNIFNVRFSRQETSEILSKLKESLMVVIPKLPVNVPFNFSVELMDSEQILDLATSCAVITYNEPRSNIRSYFIVVQNMQHADVRIEQKNGRSIEVLRVGTDAIDQALNNIVLRELRNKYSEELRLSGALVLPLGYKLEDEAAIKKLAVNALIANRDTVESLNPRWRDINLAEAKGITLGARVKFNRTESQSMDITGLPVRSDIKVELEHRYVNRNTNKTVPVSNLTAFLDLAWAPDNNAPINPYLPQTAQPQSLYKYNPRIVITSLLGCQINTVGSQLLSLVSALTLFDQNAVIQALAPLQNLAKDETDPHDVGILNVEANLTNEPNGVGKPIDTRSANFSLQDMGNYLSAIIRPVPELLLDVSDAGPESWMNDIFVEAALVPGGEAHKKLYASAVQLTNGALAQTFNPNEPIVTYANTVLNGYYIDKDKKLRDVRDIDYLWVANRLAEYDIRSLWDWSNAALNNQIPEEERLAVQKAIIEKMVADVTWTGRSKRVLFNPNFLSALAAAIASTGLTLSVNSNYANVANDARYAATTRGLSYQNLTNALFAHPGYNYGNYSHYQNRY